MDDLSTCVQCGLCLQACPTFELSGMEGYSARGRIAAMRLGERSAVIDEFLGTCLGCRACEAVCPSGVPYGRLLEHAREAMPQRGDRLMLWTIARRWRLSVLSLLLYLPQKLGLLRLAARLARKLTPASGIPRLKLRNLLVRMATNYAPVGAEKGQVVLFTGCVQDAWARDVHWATVNVLTRAGYRVRMPHGQVCCGALHAHAGRLDQARELARRNLSPLERYEGPIVVNAAGCGAKLKEYFELLPQDERAAAVAKRVRDVSEVLRPGDVRGASPPEGMRRVAVHDPCHLNFVQRVREEPRALLRAAGYEIVDLPDGGRCCGAAGSYALHHPEFAIPLRDEKLDAIREVRPDAVAVANPGCLFWMATAPGAPPMYHPVQLVAMALANVESGEDPGPARRTMSG